MALLFVPRIFVFALLFSTWMFSGCLAQSPSVPIVTTLAGNEAGTTLLVALQVPSSVVADPQGHVFICEQQADRVWKIFPNKTVVPFAGTGVQGSSGNGGPASSAQLNHPTHILLDSVGNLYISDLQNHRIQKVSTNGIISTVAGTGTQGYSADGTLAISARIDSPNGLALDPSGRLIFGESVNGCVRKIGSDGKLVTVAGVCTVSGFSGDYGPATSAKLTNPSRIVVDSMGNVLVVDRGNFRVRKIFVNGTIMTVAGNGASTFNGDGILASRAALNDPVGIFLDTGGNMYIAEYSGNRVRKVFSNGTITTLLGTGVSGDNGVGIPASTAMISGPGVVFVDSFGNLLVTDNINRRILKVTDMPYILKATSNSPFTITLTVNLPSNVGFSHGIVQFSPSSNFSNPWETKFWTGYLSLNISDLVPLQTFYFRVTGVYANGTQGRWSNAVPATPQGTSDGISISQSSNIWTCYSSPSCSFSPSCTLDSSVFLSGPSSLKFVFGQCSLYWDSCAKPAMGMNVTMGQIYFMTFWGKSLNGSLLIFEAQNPSYQNFHRFDFSLPKNWTLFQTYFVAPETCTASFYLRGGLMNQSVWIDDFSVMPIPANVLAPSILALTSSTASITISWSFLFSPLPPQIQIQTSTSPSFDVNTKNTVVMPSQNLLIGGLSSGFTYFVRISALFAGDSQSKWSNMLSIRTKVLWTDTMGPQGRNFISDFTQPIHSTVKLVGTFPPHMDFVCILKSTTTSTQLTSLKVIHMPKFILCSQWASDQTVSKADHMFELVLFDATHSEEVTPPQDTRPQFMVLSQFILNVVPF